MQTGKQPKTTPISSISGGSDLMRAWSDRLLDDPGDRYGLTNPIFQNDPPPILLEHHSNVSSGWSYDPDLGQDLTPTHT